MNRRDMIWMVRDLTTTDESLLPDSLVDQFLDEGFQRVMGARSWPFGIGNATFTTEPYMRSYDLPDDVKTIISVLNYDQSYYLTPETVERIVVLTNANMEPSHPAVFAFFEQVEHTIFDSGYEEHYEPFYDIYAEHEPAQKRLFLYPAPSDEELFEVLYRQYPAFGREDQSVPPWATGYHTILVDWGAHRAYERLGKFDASDRYRQRFESTLREMQNFYNTRNEVRPRVFGRSVSPVPDRTAGVVFIEQGTG